MLELLDSKKDKLKSKDPLITGFNIGINDGLITLSLASKKSTDR